MKQLLVPGRLEDVMSIQETGDVHKDRFKFQEVYMLAAEMQRWVLAIVRNRIIRAGAFHPQKSPYAAPTREEFALFHNRFPDVRFATLYPPDLSEAEQRSVLIRFTEGAGRPGIPDEKWVLILADLLPGHRSPDGRWRWRTSIPVTASRHNVSVSAIEKELRSRRTGNDD
jgi:hypothetical protein